MSEPFCPECGSLLTGHVAVLEEQVALLERELRSKRSQIAKLQGAQRDARPPEFEDAMEVAEYWRELCRPKARELNGPRVQNTIARLQHGYSKAELKLCVWGYSIRPNIRDGKRVRAEQGGDRHDDLELMMRDATKVDRGIAIAEQEGQCDHCGHPEFEHASLHVDGHRMCKACPCPAYDDTTQLVAQARERRAPRRHPRPKVPPPVQEKLL